MLGIVHDKDADIGILDTRLCNHCMRFAGSRKVRSRRIVDLKARQFLGGIVNNHLPKCSLVPRVSLCLFKLALNKCFQPLYRGKCHALAVILQPQPTRCRLRHIPYDVGCWQLGAGRCVLLPEQTVDDYALARLLRPHRRDADGTLPRLFQILPHPLKTAAQLMRILQPLRAEELLSKRLFHIVNRTIQATFQLGVVFTKTLLDLVLSDLGLAHHIKIQIQKDKLLQESRH